VNHRLTLALAWLLSAIRVRGEATIQFGNSLLDLPRPLVLDVAGAPLVGTS
jgi:hypothetical protein